MDGRDLVDRAEIDRLGFRDGTVLDVEDRHAVELAQRVPETLFAERLPVLYHQHRGLIRREREGGEEAVDAVGRGCGCPDPDHDGRAFPRFVLRLLPVQWCLRWLS